MGTASGWNLYGTGPVPHTFIEHSVITFNVSKGQAAGIRLNQQLAVIKIECGGAAEAHVQFGDVIQSLNGTNMQPGGKPSRQLFVDTFRKLNQKDFKCELRIMRPAAQIPLESGRLTADLKQEGFVYRTAVMYMIQGCKLALSIRAVQGKVYVSQAMEFTLAGAALRQGDAIMDVNKEAVAGNKDCSEKIMSALHSKGYVTMLVEQPEEPLMKAQVRSVLEKDKTIDVDMALPPDVIDICARELNRIKGSANQKPKKDILHKENHKPRDDKSRLRMSNDSQDTPIVADRNPYLLINVPGKPTNNYQSLAELSKNEKGK